MFHPKSDFFDFYRGLHDYFKDHSVRNAHVSSINDVGDFAVSFFEEG